MARFVAPASPLTPYVNMLTAHFYPGFADLPKTTTTTFLADNKVWSSRLPVLGGGSSHISSFVRLDCYLFVTPG